jgi:myo-inositol-1(or 4)-monophosphatase
LVPLLAKYSKFAGIDDKMRASDRVRAVSAAARPGADESVDLYARSTVTELTAAPLDGEAPAPVAAPSAPVSRKLTRIRRDTPADGSPSEGDISAK